MTNFIFKSPRRLIKNESINIGLLDKLVKLILTEQRHQRQDLVDIKRMLNKLLIEKHMQMEVDDFYEKQDRPVTEDLD